MCPSFLYQPIFQKSLSLSIGFLHYRLTGFRHIRTTVSLTCERGLCCSRTHPTAHTQRL
nr:MAG TPA: hypothetical protein [Caudoviricetes sp.]